MPAAAVESSRCVFGLWFSSMVLFLGAFLDVFLNVPLVVHCGVAGGGNAGKQRIEVQAGAVILLQEGEVGLIGFLHYLLSLMGVGRCVVKCELVCC